jgi:hypothetical protein
VDWIKLLGFFVVGRVCIYFVQTFPLTFLVADWIDKKLHYEFLGKLVRCKLCLGVWVYSFWIAGMHMSAPGWYIPVITEFTLGAGASLIAYLVEIGWYTRFGAISVGE